MLYSDKRTCPFCRKRIDVRATACPYCTREVQPAKELSAGRIVIVGGLILLVFGLCRAPATTVVAPPEITEVAAPETPVSPAATTPEPHTEWQVGESCVYNRSDDRFIGAFISSRPAPDGVNHIVTVAVDPELDPAGSIRPGTTWELTVPKNAVVKPCKSN